MQKGGHTNAEKGGGVGRGKGGHWEIRRRVVQDTRRRHIATRASRRTTKLPWGSEAKRARRGEPIGRHAREIVHPQQPKTPEEEPNAMTWIPNRPCDQLLTCGDAAG